MSRKCNKIVILWQNICLYKGKGVILHRVFHSIRFKVNKGWTTAVVLFYVLTSPMVSESSISSSFFLLIFHVWC